ncbi:MAG: GTPase Era [Bacilli bacterium]|nr:GTPase Era [Bacilli bacterium]
MRSGFVSIIGRPNVGKSTLLNQIINEHVAITSNKAGTTRNIIEGIYNEEDIQIVFVDTPGIHKPITKLGKVLNKQASSLTKDVDAILFVIDAYAGLGTGDKYILETLKSNDIPIILVLNKIDMLNEATLLQRINEYKDIYPFSEIVPISAKTKDNVAHLIEVVKGYLKDNVKYFDDGYFTSSSKYFMVSEYVREKLLERTEEEIPHSITCLTTKFEEQKDIININVDIIVDRDSIKKIVIGKNGERLKEVGILSRRDMEKLLGKKVYLELYVKTIKNWRDKERYFNELGFKDF